MNSSPGAAPQISNRTRPSRVTSRAATLVPTLAVAAFIGVGRATGFDHRVMEPVSLVLAAVALGSLRHLARRGRASPVDRAAMTFIALGAVGVWVWPEGLGRAVATEPLACLYAVLFAWAASGFVPGREAFTAFFARRKTPPAVWNTELFRRINREMSSVWTLLFATCAILALGPRLWFGAAAPVWARLAFGDALPAGLILGVGLSFNRWYPGWRQRRKGLASTGRAVSPAPADRLSTPKQATKEEPTMSQPTIVALNGSPHKGMGNTSEMLAMLRTHLEALGAQMEEVFLCRKEIQYCVGCAVCLEKGQCWIRDDHAEIVQRVLKADAVVLASPVYFEHVTAQMKAFLDRSLAYGHKPQPSWKPGLAVTVSAGMGETAVADYLGGVMRAFGAYPVGSLTAIAVGPGDFVGHDAVDACAADLAEDLMRAVRGGRRPPATDRDLRFWQFMGSLVRENQEIMADDFAHWQRHNLWEGFERYVGQERSRPAVEPALRRAWVRETIARSNRADAEHPPANAAVESSLPATCREALAAMPSSLDPRAAERVEAVYEFHVQDEGIVAHLRVSGGACSFAEEPAERPDLVIHTPGAVWLAIARGELDGQQAYLTGQYRAEGDLACLVKLPILFPRPPSGEEVRERAVARL